MRQTLIVGGAEVSVRAGRHGFGSPFGLSLRLAGEDYEASFHVEGPCDYHVTRQLVHVDFNVWRAHP